jgi:tryptophan synthase beta chain
VQLVGVEPAGEGLKTRRHGAVLTLGTQGIFHGQRTLVLADEDGQIFPAHSVSAGLDYPGVGPEHAWLRDSGRARYTAVTDDEALDAFCWLSRTEGIIPALETAHAVAELRKLAPTLPRDAIAILGLSGRGDKDAPQVRELLRERADRTDA